VSPLVNLQVLGRLYTGTLNLPNYLHSIQYVYMLGGAIMIIIILFVNWNYFKKAFDTVHRTQHWKTRTQTVRNNLQSVEHKVQLQYPNEHGSRRVL